MDTVSDPNPSHDQEMAVDYDLDDIITSLTYNKEICFKNQQKWEADLTLTEKFDIALDIFNKNKLNFLLKFGKYLKHNQLDYFKKYTEHSEPDWEEITVVLKDLDKNSSENRHNTTVKNRRYEALKQMVEEDKYFSEIEMMKRNPLLYEQLVGQYMSLDEIKARDKYKMDDQCTFVKILMEGIERDNAEAYRKQQAQNEDSQMEEEEEDDDTSNREVLSRSPSPKPSTSRWGEFDNSEQKTVKPCHKQNLSITPEERLILKEEFVTTMYHNFLDGKDDDFDYTLVDNDTSYDNLAEIDHDEEDKYFESEEPEDVKNDDVSSEDELDIYMNALNQHPTVTQLSKDLKKL